MKKITTYCQIEFLKYLFRNIPQVTMDELLLGDESTYLSYEYLFNLIFKFSNLTVNNVNKIVELSKDNPYFQKLIMSANSGGSKLTEGNIDDKLNHNYCHPSSVFLLNNYNKTIDFFYATNKNWKHKIPNISKGLTFSVNRVRKLNNFNGWNFLRNLNVPINSAIISDRYFIRYESSFDNNLFKMLSNLIPKNVEIKFHLSIISSIEDRYQNQIYRKINRYLTRNYGNSVKFGLFFPQRKISPHDRDLITNYFRLTSGNSFDYYNSTGQLETNTTLNLIPLNSFDYNNHLKKIEEMKYIMNHSKILGERENRLIDN